MLNSFTERMWWARCKLIRGCRLGWRNFENWWIWTPGRGSGTGNGSCRRGVLAGGSCAEHCIVISILLYVRSRIEA